MSKFLIDNSVELEFFKKNLSSIKAIIFDCDGTLIDSEPVHFSAWQEAFKKFNYSLSKKEYVDHFVGACDSTISKRSLQFLKSDQSPQLIKDVHDYYSAYQVLGITPIKSTLKFINTLIEAKSCHQLKLAVASGAKRSSLMLNMKNLKLTNHLDVILSGFDDLKEYTDYEGTNKPKPYIYQKAAHLLSLKPSECLAIEDSEIGIAAAVSAGCLTLAVPNAFTLHQDLSRAHLKIDSFDSIDLIAWINPERK